jgi:hypothetical protein
MAETRCASVLPREERATQRSLRAFRKSCASEKRKKVNALITECLTKTCRQRTDRLSASLAGGPLFLGYAPQGSAKTSPNPREATTRGTAHHLIRNGNSETRPILSPGVAKMSFRMSTECLRGLPRGNKEILRTSSALLRCNVKPTLGLHGWPSFHACWQS